MAVKKIVQDSTSGPHAVPAMSGLLSINYSTLSLSMKKLY